MHKDTTARPLKILKKWKPPESQSRRHWLISQDFLSDKYLTEGSQATIIFHRGREYGYSQLAFKKQATKA